MKKLISLLLAFVLASSFICTVSAASPESLSAANALHDLGLFQGVGTNQDGTPNYDLDRAPNRFEAVTMLVRLLGKEKEAKAGTWNTPFTDVADWAKPYVGYAYSNKLTNGISDTAFGGTDLVTASQYITFVLRALGYDSSKDFKWDAAWELSDELGLTNGQYNESSSFNRGDVAIISNNAFYTKMANSEKTLLDSFNENGFGKLLENERTMNEGGSAEIVEINGKYYGNAPIAAWAKEFNNEISLYVNAGACIEILKAIASDYTIEKADNALLAGILVYDMSQTSRIGFSRWIEYPTPGLKQDWIEYFYGDTSFAVPTNNNGHEDNVLYYLDGVRCFDDEWDGKKETHVNIQDLINRLGLDASISFKEVSGLGVVW